MTKRLFIGFTFLTCGLTAFATIACSSSDSSTPAGNSGGAYAYSGGTTGMGTGVGGGTDVANLGGNTAVVTPGVGGSTAVVTPGVGGSTEVTTGAGGAETVTPVEGFVIEADGYIKSGPWAGYAWTGVEEDTSVGSTIAPLSFEAAAAATPLCASGTVAAEPEYKGVAMLGLNVNQPAEGGEGSEGVWAVSGSGVTYNITNNSTSSLRIQIQGAAGYPSEAWCANVTGASGTILWADFNTQCWDNKGDAYPVAAPIALEAVMVLVPGKDKADTAFDFCVNSLGVAP